MSKLRGPRHRDDLPGPHDLAQPGGDDRRAGGRGHRPPQRRHQARSPQPGRRPAQQGRHPRPGAEAEGVSPSAVGRNASAGADRHRARLRAASAHRRRAHHCAGRHHPGPGAGGPQGARGRHPGRAAHDHPRPRRRRWSVRPRQRDVLRPDRRVDHPRRALREPRHPYTGGLLRSIPRLDTPRGEPLVAIPGSPTNTLPWSQGCAFAPRCANIVRPVHRRPAGARSTRAFGRSGATTRWSRQGPISREAPDDCRAVPGSGERPSDHRSVGAAGQGGGPQGPLPDPQRPAARSAGRRGQGRRRGRPRDPGGQHPRARRGVGLRQVDARARRCCGWPRSPRARSMYDGTDVASLHGEKLRTMRQHMQMVFQDPLASLNPRQSVETILTEPLRAHGIAVRPQDPGARPARPGRAAGVGRHRSTRTSSPAASGSASASLERSRSSRGS